MEFVIIAIILFIWDLIIGKSDFHKNYVDMEEGAAFFFGTSDFYENQEEFDEYQHPINEEYNSDYPDW